MSYSRSKKKPRRTKGSSFSHQGKTIPKTNLEILNHSKATHGIVLKTSSDVVIVKNAVQRIESMVTKMSAPEREQADKLKRALNANHRLRKQNDSKEAEIKSLKSAAAEAAEFSAGKQSGQAYGVSGDNRGIIEEDAAVRRSDSSDSSSGAGASTAARRSGSSCSSSGAGSSKPPNMPKRTGNSVVKHPMVHGVWARRTRSGGKAKPVIIAPHSAAPSGLVSPVAGKRKRSDDDA